MEYHLAISSVLIISIMLLSNKNIQFSFEWIYDQV